MGDRELLKEARRHLSEHANCGQAHAPSVLALIDRIDAALAAPVSTGEDVHGVVAGWTSDDGESPDEVLRSRDRWRAIAEGLQTDAVRLQNERDALHAMINTPEVDDFLRGVQLEGAHQVQRWGQAHDRSKSAENWHWLLAYLAGKALRAHIERRHAEGQASHDQHSSGVLQWHRAIGRDEGGRGVGADADLAKHDAEGSES